MVVKSQNLSFVHSFIIITLHLYYSLGLIAWGQASIYQTAHF